MEIFLYAKVARLGALQFGGIKLKNVTIRRHYTALGQNMIIT
jgi:hypothetical protein